MNLRGSLGILVIAVASAAAGAAARDDGDTPLMVEMEKLEAAMEVLKRSVRDAERDAESLEQIVIAQQACLAAKQMAPKMAAGVADAERGPFLAGYRKGMAAALAELATMEVKLLEGDRDAARASWKKLEQMEEDGHNEFTDGG
jgi:soluble cytochrome b562